MGRYQTDPTMRYGSEELWFPLATAITDWEIDFHTLMLNDDVRMNAYEQAIKEVVKPDMVILDLGTGTGILAQWALEAGAAHVYGIDLDHDILSRAHERLTQASLNDRYTTFEGRSLDVVLPEKIDLIISEILGNLADNEDMIPILDDARLRFLKPGGKFLPDTVETWIVPVDSLDLHKEVKERRSRAINPQYQTDRLMNTLKITNPFDLIYDAIIPRASYLATPTIVQTFNFDGADRGEYVSRQTFTVIRNGELNGFKGFFIAHLSPSVTLDISSDDIAGRTTSDCWKHAYLPIQTPIVVKVGDLIELTYSRSYPETDDRLFRQIYSWLGQVRRGEHIVAEFSQTMG